MKSEKEPLGQIQINFSSKGHLELAQFKIYKAQSRQAQLGIEVFQKD